MVFWSQRRSIPNSPARTSLYNYTSVFGVHRKGVVGRNRGGNIPKEPIVAHSAANPPHSSGQWMPTAISRSVLRMRSSFSLYSFYLCSPCVIGIAYYIHVHTYIYARTHTHVHIYLYSISRGFSSSLSSSLFRSLLHLECLLTFKCTYSFPR